MASRILPRVFIGSSSERKAHAQRIQRCLAPVAQVQVWNDNFFTPGNSALEDLVNQSDAFDFAVLVLGTEDFVTSRGTTFPTARDNVLFELGLFMGSLGRDRTYMVCEASTKLPSDLAGITRFIYRRTANLDEVSDALVRAINEKGFRRQGQRVWQLRDPASLHICVATSGYENTGLHRRPYTGKGQVVALGLVLSSLAAAYTNVNTSKQVFLSDDPMDVSQKHADFILIGSSRTNKETKRFLERLNAETKTCAPQAISERAPLKVVDTVVSKKNPSFCRIEIRVGETEETFTPKVEDGKITEDYGVVIRMPNILSPHRDSTVCLFAGTHTYGTEAAARWFSHCFDNDEFFNPRRNPEPRRAAAVVKAMREGKAIVAVIRCHVENYQLAEYGLCRWPLLFDCRPFLWR